MSNKRIKRRDRKIRPLELKVYRGAHKYFKTQGKEFVRQMGKQFARYFDPPVIQESISPSDYLPLLKQVQQATRSILENAVRLNIGQALRLGAIDVNTELGVQQDILLTQMQAFDIIGTRTEKLITGVDATTIARVDGVIMNAVASGKSWSEVALELEQLFDIFAGPPLFPSKLFRSRAEAIAVFEMGDAFEGGSMLQALSLERDLSAAGLRVTKEWINAGDAKVRPAHVTNGLDDPRPLGEEFSSGNQRPPTDPGCRCTLAYTVEV